VYPEVFTQYRTGDHVPISPDTRRRSGQTPALRVLASGSSGNATILRTARSTILIDAGLSPRRTRAHLAQLDLTLEDLNGILLTHLDSDHFHTGWPNALPQSLPVYMHSTHLRTAQARGLPRRACKTFNDVFEPTDDFAAFVTLNAHDQLGTAAFRFEFVTGASLGFATDLGSISDSLVEHLSAVDVLAIESNYCPKMQVESDRPSFLKHRVMGGSGHLSNQECAQLVAEIRPRDHVVLLHLSRQCNDPGLAARLHAREPYRLTVTSQTEPTPWIEITPSRTPAQAPVIQPEPKPIVCGSLLDHASPTHAPRSPA
jgi:phosphoribosyl 1,2-cyclic phosphodiesterase